MQNGLIINRLFAIIYQYITKRKGVIMRKRLSITILVVLLAVIMITATACHERDEEGLYKLDKPQNLALNGSTLSWDSVPNAQKYYVAIDGTEKAETTDTTYNLAQIVTGYGNFDVTVRAYGDGKKYGSSDASDVFVYRKGNALDTPVITVDKDSKTASWQAIENSVSYEVKVYDGENLLLDSLSTTETSYVFEKTGDDGKDKFADYDKYKISVVAKADEAKPEYSDSVAATAYYINSKVLSQPVLTGLSSTIRWGKVDNAKTYTLRMTHEDGTYQEFSTSGTSYQRSKFTFDKAGDYYVTIKAVGDGEIYLSSEFTEKSEDYKITKLEGINPEQISLSYDAEGKATLKWKVVSDSLADNFNLSLKALLANGDEQLDSSLTSKTVSNNVTFVVGDVYDVYNYVGADTVAPEEGATMLVYDMQGTLKVQRESVDYTVYDEDGNAVKSADFTPSASIDIVYKADAADGKNYVLMPCEYNLGDGTLAVQNTGNEDDVFGSDGKQLYFFQQEDNIDIVKYIEYDAEGNPEYNVFEVVLDDMFFKKVVSGEGEDEIVTYEALISDSDYYGKLYDISVATGNSGVKFEYGDDVYAGAQYLSYMIPTKDAFGAWYITNAGEFAYLFVNSFANPSNNDTYTLGNNVDFGGYEVPNLKEFYGTLNGNNHTVSNIVISDKRITSEGVKSVQDNAEVLSYSLFTDIKQGAIVEDIFFVGVGMKDVDLENLDESIKKIVVAPFAINNYGSIYRTVLQADAIEVESADIAGFVLNNYNYLSNVQVYADIKGRNVAGITLNNKSQSATAFARMLNCGFNGDIECNIGEYLNDGVKEIYGASLALFNESVATDDTVALINGCFSIGSVTVNGEALDGVYAAGLVAVNKSQIMTSYAGEFTLNNVYESVTANGNNGYAGGLIAHNIGTVQNCYATGKASASEYAGGFVGLNEGTITSCYSTGNTTVGGTYNGAFAASSTGTIDKCASYSSDNWAKDSYTTLFTVSEELPSIISVLYPEGEAQMSMVSGQGYRNPLLNGMVYTKDYEVTMLPATADTVANGIIAKADGTVSEIEGGGDTIYGSLTKGSTVVVALAEDGTVRYVIGTVK